MTSKEYRLIDDEDTINEVFTPHHDETLGFGKKYQFFNSIVSFTLALSLTVNALLILLHFLYKPQDISSTRTAFGTVAPDTCIIQLIND